MLKRSNLKDKRKPLWKWLRCKGEVKENVLNVGGGFVVSDISLGLIMSLAFVISNHLTLSHQSEAAADEIES